MSDTIYKWAMREVDVLALNDRPLDADHLMAIAWAASRKAVELRQPLFPDELNDVSS